MEIKIRLGRNSEIGEIVRLIDREHELSGAVMKVSSDIVRKWIKLRRSVVAVSDGKIVGHEALDVWPESGWAELRSAVVLEDFRGRGIAYKMTRRLLDDFLSKNHEAIFVAIKNRTERGNKLLLEMGFKEIGLDEVPPELFTIRSNSERRAFRLKVKK
jgi:N-acetylglutamate synthase-like GNAT family acetyltransferase